MLRKVDRYILIAAGLLILTGVVMMLSVSLTSGDRDFNDGFYYVKRHILYLLLGALVAFFTLRMDYNKLQKYALPGLAGALILLGLTYLPWLGAGRSSYGASRWLSLGFFSFQPAELAKVFIVIYVALAMTKKQNLLKDFWRGIVPLLGVSGLIILAVLGQPDLGTSIVIGLTVLAMLVVGGSNLADLFILSVVGLRCLFFKILMTPYQLRRLTIFLDPWQDARGAGWHTIQSLIAVGSGGLLGLGLGHSRQKFYYLPQNYNDFIFAVLCEEGGFVCAAVIIAAFAVLVLRGLRLAVKVENPFGSFLALGYSFCLGIQAVVNVMVVTALLPNKGITLPFVSYGGTSLIVSMFMLAVILRVSLDARDKTEKINTTMIYSEV